MIEKIEALKENFRKWKAFEIKGLKVKLEKLNWTVVALQRIV